MGRAAKSSGTALSFWPPMTLRQRSTRACVAACQASVMPSMLRCAAACQAVALPGAAVRHVQAPSNPSERTKKRRVTPSGVITGASRPRGSPGLLS